MIKDIHKDDLGIDFQRINKFKIINSFNFTFKINSFFLILMMWQDLGLAKSKVDVTFTCHILLNELKSY